MFRPQTRQSPFADFIDWTDYRFEGQLRRPAAPPWAHRRRQPLLRILIFLAIVWVVSRLIRGRRYSSWF